nr:DNA translocase FtsK [Desulfofarcimen acetoxidans]
MKLRTRIRCEIAGLASICLGIIAALCLLNPTAGVIAYLVEAFLKGSLGEARFMVPLLFILSGLKLLIKPLKGKTPAKIYGAVLLLVVVLAFWHLPLAGKSYFRAALSGDGGGLIGAVMIFLITESFGMTGSYIILVTLFIVAVLLLTNVSLVSMLKALLEKIKYFFNKIKLALRDFLYEEVEEEALIKIEQVKRAVQINNGRDAIIGDTGKETNQGQATYSISAKEAGERDSLNDSHMEVSPALHLDFINVVSVEEQSNEKNCQTAEDLAAGDEPAVDLHSEPSGYQIPPLQLLQQPLKVKNSKTNKDISHNIQVLEKTLASFGVKARVTMVSRGPALTRYEIQPPVGIKVSRIMNLADDIALSMAVPDVRIEAPVPGKAAVGIEVPNKEVSRVYLRDLLETRDFQLSSSCLTVVLGKDIAGSPIIADLSKMPHLLIAGATGSGKSVCMNTLIASILFKASPEEVKFLIIDPKMVELTTYNGIPHLVSPVVTAPKKAATALRWAVREMEHRYRLFAAAGVKDIVRYNKLQNNKKSQGENKTLHLVVILIDELADLMMVAPADVEDAVCRLAQMARAAGMHLVVATQRPSVDVITGLIKANIPSRISFAVSSQVDSRTILDTGGAEKLLGRGDMLFSPIGAAKPLRVQGAYLSDKEVENLVNYLKQQVFPVQEQDVTGELEPVETEQALDDELLPRAVEIFIESGQASISMLQRRLRIGYARAARLIDMMEQKGIVGQFEGSKPRAVLINEEEYRQMFNCQ